MQRWVNKSSNPNDFDDLLFPCDFCAEGVEAEVDVLVAAVDLLNVVDFGSTLGTHGGEQHGYTGTDIGRGHAPGAELELVVVAYDNGAVGVAEDDLGAHVDELVDEEQAALEHLLVYEHAALALGGDHQQNAQKVRLIMPWLLLELVLVQE